MFPKPLLSLVDWQGVFIAVTATETNLFDAGSPRTGLNHVYFTDFALPLPNIQDAIPKRISHSGLFFAGSEKAARIVASSSELVAHFERLFRGPSWLTSKVPSLETTDRLRLTEIRIVSFRPLSMRIGEGLRLVFASDLRLFCPPWRSRKSK